MPSLGIDRETGKIMTGWQHTIQSINVIFTTLIGERVMLREFGNAAPILLGRMMTVENILRWRMMLAIALELWEPRVRVAAIRVASTVPTEARLGHLTFNLELSYRPNALQGDFTPETGLRSLSAATTVKGTTVNA